ncbi:MAG: hypothetical protein JW889_08255 [Verrucomicrobia bacterium]|nr:hypothetical protein [Verrucomicrobiota bacterium]
MIKTFCDRCGREIKSKTIHYELKIEVKAAYETLEINLADLLKDHAAEIEALMDEVEHADPQQLQDDVYKVFHFHLCRSCQQHYIRAPLPSTRPPAARDRFRRLPLPELDD